MKLITLVETTMGPLEVKTQTVPWVWTVLTLGLFRKAVCQVKGPARSRYYEIRMKAAKRFNHTPPKRNEDWMGVIQTVHTIFWRISFWHEHNVEYVQAQGGVMSGYHYGLQLHHNLYDALQSDDPGSALRVIEKMQTRSKEALERHRASKPF